MKNSRFSFSEITLMLSIVLLSASRCTETSATAELQRVEELRTAVPKTPAATPDTSAIYPFVRAVAGFAKAYPEAKETPALLMDAAGLASGSGWGNKSIELWGYVWRQHPDYARAPEALFYQGFTMDTQYQDYRLAAEYYDRFLEQYPQHELAEQVRQLLAVAKAGGKLPAVPAAPSEG